MTAKIAEMKESPLTKAEKEELVLEFFNTRRRMKNQDFEGDDPTMYAWEDMEQAGIVTKKGEIKKTYMMAMTHEQKENVGEYLYDNGPWHILLSEKDQFPSIKDPIFKDLLLDAKEAVRKLNQYIGNPMDPADML